MITFCGPAGAESRGVVDLLAVRKDQENPMHGTKRGDALHKYPCPFHLRAPKVPEPTPQAMRCGFEALDRPFSASDAHAMKPTRTPIQVFLGILACVAMNYESASAAPDSPSEKGGSVLKAADELAAAVRARDLDALLRLVAPDGVPCIDSMVSRQELKRQLRAPDTFLGAYFFAPEVFKTQFADPLTKISFAEFVATAREVRVTVSGKQHPLHTCVHFTASNIESTPLFCFRRVRDRWVLGDLPNCA